MKIIKKNVHRGEILREAVENTGLNIEVIAKKAGYKRGTYYLHRRKGDLSLKILAKYARAIGHDFAEEVPGMNKFTVDEEGSGYKTEPATVEEALKERDDWKDKYYALMDKYGALMDKYLDAIKPD